MKAICDLCGRGEGTVGAEAVLDQLSRCIRVEDCRVTALGKEGEFRALLEQGMVE